MTIPPSTWPLGYVPTYVEWDAAFANLARTASGTSVVGNLLEYNTTDGTGLQDSGIVALSLTGSLATIAALRAATSTLVPLGRCVVLGYTTTADGGEGIFVASPTDTTSADNGGTIIVDASGRRWYREAGGLPISVKWFGAFGNGSTDDTAAIQAAITLAGTSAAVFFPSGTYYVATGLTASGSCHIYGNAATILGPTSGTQTLLAITGVNNGSADPFYQMVLNGLMFRVRGNYSALSVSNGTFLGATFEAGPIISDSAFTSIEYTGTSTTYLVSSTLVSNARLSRCSFVTYSANGLNGVNAGLGLLGCANWQISGTEWNYCGTAISYGSSGSQITQGIVVTGCGSNGCLTSLSSQNTNNCSFVGGIWDNHKGQAITSLDDLGLFFSSAYIGSSYTANPIVAISVLSGNADQAAQFVGCTFAQYTAGSPAAISMAGVSGTYYNNAQITDCQFYDAQHFANVINFSYSANCVVSGCSLSGVPSGQFVAATNPPGTTYSARCSSNAGVNPVGSLPAKNYTSPTALATVGSNAFYQNPYPFDCMVYITGSTVTNINLQTNGGTQTQVLSAAGAVLVPAGASIAAGFSSGTPTWSWYGL